MLRLGRSLSIGAQALLVAFLDKEITVREFSEGMRFLTPEEMQVLATSLSLDCNGSAKCRDRQMAARNLSLKLASTARVWS
jgi:hypothetical protein